MLLCLIRNSAVKVFLVDISVFLHAESLFKNFKPLLLIGFHARQETETNTKTVMIIVNISVTRL